MNQEKIGNFIKKIRKDNNLSQAEFADRLGVSFQAVSKWENGKNLPDLSTLQLIKKEFNVKIDEIIDGEEETKVKNNKKIKILIISIISVLVIALIIFIIIKNSDNTFLFNELNSTNTDFSISGSIVKTNDRTSIIINNVNYKGEEDNTVYEELTCTLYEEKNDTKTKITSCDNGENETLLEYLENVKMRMDHKSASCSMFTSSNVFIEISAKDKNNKSTVYNIPIEISEENCAE